MARLKPIPIPIDGGYECPLCNRKMFGVTEEQAQAHVDIPIDASFPKDFTLAYQEMFFYTATDIKELLQGQEVCSAHSYNQLFEIRTPGSILIGMDARTISENVKELKEAFQDGRARFLFPREMSILREKLPGKRFIKTTKVLEGIV